MTDDDLLYNLEDDDTDLHEEEVLYAIPDEREENRAGVGHGEEELPYAYGSEDADEEAEEGIIGRSSRKASKRSSAALLFGCMFGPSIGWKDLKRSRRKPAAMAAGCFAPLAAFASLSLLVNFFYQANQSLGSLMVEAIIIFLSYIFSYITLPIVGRPFLPVKVNESLQTDFGKNSVMAVLSTLCIFKILYHLLPSLEPVIVFLPLWTIYLVFKLVPMLKAPKEKEYITTVIMCILTLGLPMAWSWLLGLFL